jgi:hypothetical protein
MTRTESLAPGVVGLSLGAQTPRKTRAEERSNQMVVREFQKPNWCSMVLREVDGFRYLHKGPFVIQEYLGWTSSCSNLPPPSQKHARRQRQLP